MRVPEDDEPRACESANGRGAGAKVLGHVIRGPAGAALS
jgi:hypothetical protein